jgi:hypothetical protein
MTNLSNDNCLYKKNTFEFTLTNSGTYTFNFSGLSDGLYQLSIYAKDNPRYIIISFLNNNDSVGSVEKAVNLVGFNFKKIDKTIEVGLLNETYYYSLTKL